ncbi:tubulin folding cofactor D C terminal-domain-containing protein [Apiosordaria backusii]|uniref:Tubulin folding cofactor D C terminal-domain-containing protein n=1 Tax=Apiosordaria backusii TaxID=314023 RepID=A0AA40AAN8_9PEZI|nr:tubulin folding cofactor D C terminal-domain-containing protein [Apiosordaria backusii]
MDAPIEDSDIKLQKVSADLISEFDSRLPLFLFRRQRGGGDTSQKVRRQVTAREADKLIAGCLDPFQELPQLLDPYLSKWISLLSSAFISSLTLASVTSHSIPNPTITDDSSHEVKEALLIPLTQAISKIIYTLCKIRGEKVVVRFLGNEVSWLEPLLSFTENNQKTKTWEERYVGLLWLSHLLFAPFDLATISSSTHHYEDDAEDEDGKKEETVVVEGLDLQWEKLPGITVRVLPLAIQYLGSPGKERDAAKALLVRLALRRDMQELGVLDGMLRWALRALRQQTEEKTPYHYIGVLSFLAGVLTSSADTSDMDPYLVMIIHAVYEAAEGSQERVMTSALARKAVIKVVRAVAVLILRGKKELYGDYVGLGLVETTIGFLLDCLGDNDTPVRFAASKALSIIALRLEQDMASEVVEAVLEGLNKNVLRDKKTPGKKDLSAVNPLEWHGLMLTLSHLLYRRSPPPDQLADIVQALITGISFERRALSGGSSGTNVRDAACFGIWAMARRYTTKELLAVPTESLTTGTHTHGSSVLQITATELVVAACLDPAGNIRRGSSAALQELIGRHPDTITEGIWVVQTVDYHAVALRARALQDVALGVTKLSPRYGEAILDALLGWRGVGDVDAASRRAVGASFGALTAELALTTPDPLKRLQQSVSLARDALKSLQARQVEERHGLLISIAGVFDGFPRVIGGQADYKNESLINFVSSSANIVLEILSDCNTDTYRRPELVAEGASRLIISAAPILQASMSTSGVQNSPSTIRSGPELIEENAGEITQLVKALGERQGPVKEFVKLSRTYLAKWLLTQEPDLITPAADAALTMLIFSDDSEREEIVKEWAGIVRHRPTSSRVATWGGHFSALAMSYSIASTLLTSQIKKLICDSFVERWNTDPYTDVHVAVLQSLTRSNSKSGLLRDNTDIFLPLIAEGLDDYTTTAQGDVGSMVRFQAIRATKALWTESPSGPLVEGLILRILRLAAEKLDRVRAEAQVALSLILKPEYKTPFLQTTFSSTSYFTFLLSLPSKLLDSVSSSFVFSTPSEWLCPLLSGYVSSADTGNEELVIATRSALLSHCLSSPVVTLDIVTALISNLRTHQKNDRVLVPTLEVLKFLFDMSVAPSEGIDWKRLCLLVQKAAYKTGNVRKLEACIGVYGGVVLQSGGDGDVEGREEAKKRLGGLLGHPWPRVRSAVVDQLWRIYSSGHMQDGEAGKGEKLLGTDWGAAGQGDVQGLVKELGLVSTTGA